MRVIKAVIKELEAEKEKEAAKAAKEAVKGDDLVYELMSKLNLSSDVLNSLK